MKLEQFKLNYRQPMKTLKPGTLIIEYGKLVVNVNRFIPGQYIESS